MKETIKTIACLAIIALMAVCFLVLCGESDTMPIVKFFALKAAALAGLLAGLAILARMYKKGCVPTWLIGQIKNVEE